MIAGAPQGYDALVLARLARLGRRTVLHVAEDEGRMAQMAQAVAFFAPDIELLTFPAWDCLPYDRVSPNGEVVARRIETLTRLAESPRPPSSTPRVVVATVSAVLQRLPPRETFAGAVFAAKKGDVLPLETLTDYLVRNGYVRAETVREPGEYAVRGGILDLPAEMVDAVRRVLHLLAQQRDIHVAVGHVDRAGLAAVQDLHLEHLAVEFGELVGVTGDDGEMTDLRPFAHGCPPSERVAGENRRLDRERPVVERLSIFILP